MLSHYRTVLLLGVLIASTSAAETPWPSIAEAVSPVEIAHPRARDGHETLTLYRNPPGAGAFPAVICLHGGLRELPEAALKQNALGVTPSRFLAAGFVVVVPTFRDRTEDPQSPAALEDCKAVVAFVRGMKQVDPASIVVWGISGGGSLALELAGDVPLAAVIAEEPATILFTGMFNSQSAKRGATFTAADSGHLMRDPQRYYTPERQAVTRDKIGKIQCPIFIAGGGRHPINRFNNEIFIPELQKAGKRVKTVLYPGAPHGFSQGSPSTEAAREFFQDALAFLLPNLKVKPAPMDARLIGTR